MSRATRGEILPLFYQMSTFSLEYHGRTWCTMDGEPEPYRPYGKVTSTLSGQWIVREPMALMPESRAFLDHIPQRWLRLIKQFHLTVKQHVYDRLPLTLSITLEIDRMKGVYAARVRDVTNEGFRQITVEKKVQEYIDRVIGEVRWRHRASENRADSCFNPSDFIALGHYFEEIARQHGQ